MKRKISRNISLTTGSISQGLIYFALPLLLTNLLQQAYYTADLMIVGRFAGKEPMAAVGASSPVSLLLISLFSGLTVGASVVVSQLFGASDRKSLIRAVQTSYFITVVWGIVISVIGIVSAPFFLRILNTPPEIFDMAVIYMRLFYAGVTPLLIYNMGATILRSIGDSKRPFRFLLICAVINIVLDLIFIGYFSWGVVGAAVATLISQFVSAGFVVLNLVKSERIFKLDLKDMTFYKGEGSAIVKIGIPSALSSSMMGLSNVLIQGKINLFGSDAIAGIAAEGKIDAFLFMSAQAIALAATTFAGQNYGAKLFERLKHGLKLSVIISLILSNSLAVFAIYFRRELISIFNNSENVIYYGAGCLFVLSLSIWMYGLSEVFSGYIRGTGDALGPMIISVISICVVRIVWIVVAINVYKTVEVIYYSYPISYAVNMIAIIIYYFAVHKKKIL